VVRADLARIEDEISAIGRALEALHPIGVEGRKVERETEPMDELQTLEDEREGILAELEPEPDEDEDAA
jgi:hypothetical protein